MKIRMNCYALTVAIVMSAYLAFIGFLVAVNVQKSNELNDAVYRMGCTSMGRSQEECLARQQAWSEAGRPGTKKLFIWF